MASSTLVWPERKGWPKPTTHSNGTSIHLLGPRQTPQDLKTWVEELGKLNRTNWTVCEWKNSSAKIIYKQTFRCHHSSYNKSKNAQKKSKNLNCPANIVVAVRRDQITYLTTIEVFHQHNHPLHNAEILGHLHATKETRDAFDDYFKSGMGIADSLAHHKCIQKFDEESLADGLVNPKYDVVKRWYKSWHTAKVGPRYGCIIKMLQEKKAEYAQLKVEMEIREDPLVVVIMTEVMRRANIYAGNVVFLDSTASCDNDSYTVTFMLVDTEAGSVPIAVMITKGQTMREYEACFRIVREMMGDEGFGGSSAPEIFMTDDSDAERGALKNVFMDECKYLLCTFHVKQAVGRWLSAKQHNISMDDRMSMSLLFSNILHSSTPVAADEEYAKLISSVVCCKYELFLNYIEMYWKRCEEWCLAFRDSRTRGNQTNNRTL